MHANKQAIRLSSLLLEVCGSPIIWWLILITLLLDWLAVSHHGRGIMTAALGLLMSAWAIPRMGARHVVAHTVAGNIASHRVFEKNGFVNRGSFDNGKIV